MNNNAIEIINLTKIFKKTNAGIKNLNFTVKKGDFHALIGENGAGKTTTIKSIINAIISYKGEIFINGHNAREKSIASKVTYIPEKTNFEKDIKLWDYLYFFALLDGLKRKEAKEKITHYLKLFGLYDRRKKRPYTFSSGEKKKVLIIEAIISNSDIWILDEPAANLDPKARIELYKVLKAMNENGKTIILSSHILSELERYCNSLTIINKGVIVYTGPKTESIEETYNKYIENDLKKFEDLINIK
ncbi:ABC transporter ATP-binding protein [Mycoplasmopsis cricetuli]|uniref:ABC transporter ATP-binding protein n=1 Tax=Mycoplasmopsis cricetuli TaxID=171283 RepID=UPI00046F45FB|nr:ABC transporter ATP-binding protein [Mycoplasmopsis cricetuli]